MSGTQSKEGFTLPKPVAKGGFTLIELLVVIAIIGVLALFSWVNLYQIGSQQELRNARRGLVALLRDAQQRSLTQVEGRYWGVYFEKNPAGDGRDRYSLFNSGVLPDPDKSFTKEILTVITLKPLLELQQSAATSTIAFHQIGGGLVSKDCPNTVFNEPVSVGLKNDPTVSITVQVFCNGRVEF